MKTLKIQSLSLKLTGSISFDIESIDINQVSLFVGANGTGKTMIMVLMYVMCEIAKVRQSPSPMLAELVNDYSNFITDACISDFNSTGVIRCNFTEDKFIEVTYDSGKVTNVECDIDSKEYVTPYVSFSSKNLRTFDSIKVYLSMRKMANTSFPGRKAKNPQLFIAQMLGAYKLYDVMYVEEVIENCPIELTEKHKTVLSEFSIDSTSKRFIFDEDKCDFFFEFEDGSLKALTTYSAGEQSIINMFVANKM